MVAYQRVVQHNITKEANTYTIHININTIFFVDILCKDISDITLHLRDGNGDDQQYDQ